MKNIPIGSWDLPSFLRWSRTWTFSRLFISLEIALESGGVVCFSIEARLNAMSLSWALMSQCFSAADDMSGSSLLSEYLHEAIKHFDEISKQFIYWQTLHSVESSRTCENAFLMFSLLTWTFFAWIPSRPHVSCSISCGIPSRLTVCIRLFFIPHKSNITNDCDADLHSFSSFVSSDARACFQLKIFFYFSFCSRLVDNFFFCFKRWWD